MLTLFQSHILPEKKLLMNHICSKKRIQLRVKYWSILYSSRMANSMCSLLLFWRNNRFWRRTAFFILFDGLSWCNSIKYYYYKYGYDKSRKTNSSLITANTDFSNTLFTTLRPLYTPMSTNCKYRSNAANRSLCCNGYLACHWTQGSRVQTRPRAMDS
jgi:hypothetical protein